MRSDGDRSEPGSKQVYKTREGEQDPISTIRDEDGQFTASRRWLGRRPDGPGAEPVGKERAPLRIADSESLGG